MRLQWLLHLEATCDLINYCLQNSLVPLMMNFFYDLDISNWLSCFFKLHYFHLKMKKYFQFWDFPRYILTCACYNTSNFLYLRMAISWLWMFYNWDLKIHFVVIIYDYMYTCASEWRGIFTCMQTPQSSKELDGLEWSNRRL